MYVTSDLSLPRSLDVQISVSKAQAETRTDLSILAVVCEGLGFLPDSNRIRIYSDIDAVAVDFATNTEAYLVAATFFAQSPHATRMAIAEAWLTAIPAQLAGLHLTATDISAIKAVSAGSMNITYNPGTGAVVQQLTAMDFSSCDTATQIASVIQAKLTAGLSCSVKTLPGGDQIINIVTTATGDGVAITYPVAGATGTFVGTLLKLTSASGGSALNGYTPTDIAGELSNIVAAANSNGYFVYGWTFGASLRDVTIQTTAAAWALAQDKAMMVLTTNDLTALSSSYTTDLGSLLKASGNKRAVPLYHDNPQRYPDVSILAYMLSVNYQLKDSTVTAKFKTLPGIETVQLTETQWQILKNKGYNTYTAIGNSSRTYREGTSEDSAWYMDTVINLDNFVEDLSVNVYNVFLRNKKVPYTAAGQGLLIDACRDTGKQYVYNGSFADREVSDDTAKSGVSITKAVVITPTPISQSTVASRASRIGPPISMVVQDAGAIHSIAINVEVVS